MAWLTRLQFGKWGLRLFVVLGVLYFGYHFWKDGKPLLLFSNREEILRKQGQLEVLQEQKRALDNLVSRMQEGSIDPDILEEQARDKLHYMGEDEIVLPIPESRSE